MEAAVADDNALSTSGAIVPDSEFFGYRRRNQPSPRSAAAFVDEFDRLKGEQASKRQDLAKLIGFDLKMTLSANGLPAPLPPLDPQG